MPAAARHLDFHACPMVNPGPVPHVGGPIIASGTVFIGGLPAAKVGDTATCCGPPDLLVVGSSTVKVQGVPLARQGGGCTAHGGTIVGGCPTVIIGG